MTDEHERAAAGVLDDEWQRLPSMTTQERLSLLNYCGICLLIVVAVFGTAWYGLPFLGVCMQAVLAGALGFALVKAWQEFREESRFWDDIREWLRR